jgi:hypothetical protein
MTKGDSARTAKDRLYFVLSMDRANCVCECPPSRIKQCYSGRICRVFDADLAVLQTETAELGWDAKSGRWSCNIIRR